MKDLEISLRIGMTAIELIIEIVKANPKISSFFLAIYTPVKRLMKDPFDRISYHNSVKRLIEIPRQEATSEKFNKFLDSLTSRECLAFVSKVKLTGHKEVFHIPLMDFNCEVLISNLITINNFLIRIGQKKGVILFSGKSYQYYGIEPLSEKDRLIFLGHCLLYDYIDSYYIGHQLIEGYEILRISSSIEHSKFPTVISVL